MVTMSKRQLSTLPLSGSILNALGRAGYETIEDLNDATPEGLARGKPLFLVAGVHKPTEFME